MSTAAKSDARPENASADAKVTRYSTLSEDTGKPAGVSAGVGGADASGVGVGAGVAADGSDGPGPSGVGDSVGGALAVGAAVGELDA